MILSICGSPGVGKKTVGRILSNTLRARLVNLNFEAISHGLGKRDETGEFVVDITALSNHVHLLLKKRGEAVIIGHLIPEVVSSIDTDFVFVLRASPRTLIERYRGRRYPPEKIKENAGAEILDIPLVRCVEKFGASKVIQIDTTGKKAEAVAKQILGILRGNLAKRNTVNWLKDVNPKILGEYFDSTKQMK